MVARSSSLSNLLLVLGAALLAPLTARAAEPDEKEEFDPRVHLETDEDAAGVLRAAWRARSVEPPAQPNWRMAIEKYLEVARCYGHTVFPQSDRLFLPMRSLVRRELASLPKEGRELYQVLKGREAELAFRRALASGSTVELERVAALYPCLPSAPRALYLLGEMARARGDAGRAVYYWQRLMSEYPEWGEAGRPALLARSALVAIEAGRRGEGERLLAELNKAGGLTKLRVGAAEVLIADEVQKRLTAAGGSAGPDPAAETSYWPSMGGGPAHDRLAARAVDAGVRNNKQHALSDGMSGNAKQMMAQYGVQVQAPALPPRHPVCAGGMIYLAGDTDLIALGAITMSVAWPATKKGQVNDKLPCRRMTLPAVGDGKIYAVLGTPRFYNPYMGMRQQDKGRSDTALRAYALVGGKLKWESGAREDAATREFLEGLDLAATPVYAGGYVYCPAVKRGSINDAWVLCFDADDGRLVWKTFVCAGHPVRIGQYHNTQSISEDGLPPAVSQGLVAFVSNLGAVGVMDASSGDLLWIYLYDRAETGGTTDRFGRRTNVKVDIWAPSAPIISEGVLYAAPQDCPELLALDLTTGELRWKSRRGDLKHLVGVSGDRLICSGGNEVVAFSARTGKRLWRGLLSGEEAGLGLVGADFALVPSTTGLQRFDLRTGKLVASYRFQDGAKEAGNLVISEDVLVSAGKTAVSSYFSWEEITTKLKRQIAADPQAAQPLARMGEVHFSGEKYREAADFFKQALARVKPGERSGGVLLEPVLKRNTWESYSRLGAALEKERKFEEALTDYREAHKYAQDENELMTGHMRFARCMEGLGRWAEAVAHYQESIYTKASGGGRGGLSRYYDETHTETGGRKVMAGRFAQSTIDKLIASHGREVYARFEAEARAHLDAAGRESSIAKAAEVVDRWPNSEALSPALILLSELLGAEGKHAEASARLREHLSRLSKSPRTLEVRARLALSYKAQGMAPLARSMMGWMMRTSKDGEFELKGQSWKVPAFVEANMPKGDALPGQGLAAELKAPFKRAWEAGNAGMPALIPKATIHELTGLAFIRQNQTEVVAVDMNSGKKVWSHGGLTMFGRNNNLVSGLASSGVLAVGSGDKLIGLAPGTGQVLWEQQILEQAANPVMHNAAYLRLAIGDGAVVALVSQMTFAPNVGQRWSARLLALDEATGKEIWSVEGLPYANICDVSIREGTVYVAGYNQTNGQADVQAYDVAVGSKRFAATLKRSGQAGLVHMYVHGERLLAVAGSALSCYDTATGKLKWCATGTGSGWAYISAVDDSRAVLTVWDRQKVLLSAIDLDTGKKRWDSGALTGNAINPNQGYYFLNQLGYSFEPAQSTDRVMAYAMDWRTRKSTYAAYDGASGKLLWRTDCPMGNGQPSLPVVGRDQAGALVSGQAGQERRVWDLASGKLVDKASVPGRFGYLTVQEGAVLQVSQQSVERLDPAGGSGGSGGGKKQ